MAQDNIYIHTDPAILGGKPVEGTRLSVEFLRSLIEIGWTDEQILDSYPHLTAELLQAVKAWKEA